MHTRHYAILRLKDKKSWWRCWCVDWKSACVCVCGWWWCVYIALFRESGSSGLYRRERETGRVAPVERTILFWLLQQRFLISDFRYSTPDHFSCLQGKRGEGRRLRMSPKSARTLEKCAIGTAISTLRNAPPKVIKSHLPIDTQKLVWTVRLCVCGCVGLRAIWLATTETQRKIVAVGRLHRIRLTILRKALWRDVPSNNCRITG